MNCLPIPRNDSAGQGCHRARQWQHAENRPTANVTWSEEELRESPVLRPGAASRHKHLRAKQPLLIRPLFGSAKQLAMREPSPLLQRGLRGVPAASPGATAGKRSKVWTSTWIEPSTFQFRSCAARLPQRPTAPRSTATRAKALAPRPCPSVSTPGHASPGSPFCCNSRTAARTAASSGADARQEVPNTNTANRLITNLKTCKETLRLA